VRVGPNGHAYKDDKTAAYMSTCILFMRRSHHGAPLSGCLAMTMDVYLRRPAHLVPKVGPRVRAPQPPAHVFPAPCKPDASNVLKAVEDALTQAGVIVDDKAIAGHVLHKWYVAVGDSPRVEVTLSRMPGGWTNG
jgi:Holliday junction resolvase RusA-like endonuclease